jgi:acyl-CoA synthetase (NDP forming)
MAYGRLRDWCRASDVKLYPVSTTRATVDGDEAFRSVLDVPEDVDVAVVLVGDAESAVRDAVDKGCKFAVVFSAGFDEVGEEGERKQRRLEEIIRSGRTHLVGPNTAPNLFEHYRVDIEGRSIALVTQSGAIGRPVFQAQDIGIKMSHWAPTGNEADLEVADFIRYFADQPGVGAIAAYIEGFKDGRTFLSAVQYAAAQETPVVMIKVGRTPLGASWARSHTGHLAGDDAVVSAVCRQHGVVRVEGVDELIDTSAMLARWRPARGRGVVAYTTSGGTGTLFADMAEGAGLTLPRLSDETDARLRQWIPTMQRVSNPVDGGGVSASDWRGPLIIQTLLQDPALDVLVVPLAGSFAPMSDRLVEDLVRASKDTDKPICVIWTSPTTDEAVYRDVLLRSKISVFRTFRNCVVALKGYFDYWDHSSRRRPTGPSTTSSALTASSARVAEARRQLRQGRPALSERASKDLLSCYGIPVSDDVLCTTADEAVHAAGTLGYPVVLKASSPLLTHKSDLGLVIVGIESDDAVRSTFRELAARAEQEAPGSVEGVLVSELVSGGIETIVGITHDPTFGPVVMFGLGGIAAELYADVTFRTPPFDASVAREMIDDVRSARLLSGYRGRPKSDLDALVDVLVKLQAMALDLQDDLLELDINPLVVGPDRTVALDALAVRKS